MKVILNIDGKEHEVLSSHYHFDRDTDRHGRPSTDVRGGKITVQIRSSDDSTFFDWMADPFAQKDGEISFPKINDPSAPLKVLKFTEAYLVDYSEDFDHDSSEALTETLTFSARTIGIDVASTIEREWLA